MRRIFTCMIVGVFFLFLSSCSNIDKKPSQVILDYPTIINGIEIVRTPKRVAVFSPSLAEIINDMGYTDRLFGRTDECNTPSEIQSIPSAGSIYNLDLEVINRWVPELILFDSPPENEIAAALHDAGHVIVVIPPANNYSELITTYTAIGKIFAGENKGQDEASTMLKSINSRLEKTESIIQSVVAENLPKALIVTDSFGHVITGRSFAQRLFDITKITNLAYDEPNWTAKNEQKAAAEIIFCPIELLDIVKKMEGFKNSPAVANGKIYAIDITSIEKQGLCFADIAEKIGKYIYPDAFSDFEENMTSQNETEI